MRLVWARPVGSFFRSAWKVCTHLLMRTAASFLRSSSMMSSSRRGRRSGSLEGDHRAHVLAAHDARQIAGIVEIEHPQRQAVVAAHDDGGGVHDVEAVIEHLVEG